MFFESVVDGENVFSSEPRLPTLDGRDGGLAVGLLRTMLGYSMTVIQVILGQ